MKERKYPRWARPLLRDKCDHCHGQKGGIEAMKTLSLLMVCAGFSVITARMLSNSSKAYHAAHNNPRSKSL